MFVKRYVVEKKITIGPKWIKNTRCKSIKPESYYKRVLSQEAFMVAREGGKERPYANQYWDHFEEGEYGCVCCGTVLFSSNRKFDSFDGRPAFSAPVRKQVIKEDIDLSNGFTEPVKLKCNECDGHLGKLYEDGPLPTRLRYAVNSASLDFKAKKLD